ncbi:MAG: cupredoxin family copper-binding protein [Nanoarchaeota archaeon]
MIVLLIILAAVVVAGFFIFSGNNQQGGSYNNQVPADNSQTGTQSGAGDTEIQNETTTQPQEYSVEIKGFAFSPSTLTIKKGDTVTWTNMDSTQHTVTSDSGNELDSSFLSVSQSYSHTFAQVGTFSYHCKPHPGMKAKIVVE